VTARLYDRLLFRQRDEAERRLLIERGGPFTAANLDAIQAEVDYATEHYGPEDFRS
jgi:hypothetical protein